MTDLVWSQADQVAVRAELARILASAPFQQSARKQRFLKYIVAETLAGRGHRLKGYSVGVEVFDRPPTFDPVADPIVRIEAGRLREKLDAYYRTAGSDDPIRIDLPKGTYAPTIDFRVKGGIYDPRPRQAAHDALLRGLERHWCYTLASCAEAQKSFLEAIEIDPGYSMAHYWIARSYVFHSSLLSKPEPLVDAALQHATRTVELDTRSAAARSVLGWSLLFQNNSAKAIVEAERACEIDPTAADARVFLSLMLSATGRCEEALRSVELAMALQPHPSSLYFDALGTAHFGLGNFDRAIEAFVRGTKTNPSYFHCQQGLAISFAVSGRTAAAEFHGAFVRESWPHSMAVAYIPFTDGRFTELWERGREIAGLG